MPSLVTGNENNIIDYDVMETMYNHTLTLEVVTQTTDDQGGITEAWASAGTFEARISILKAEERMAQDKVTTFATHRIYCEPMSVSTENRIKWGDYYFQIKGITNPSEDYHHLQMDVLEIDD